MRFDEDTDESNEKEDFYEKPISDEQPQRRKREPRIKPDDPDYYYRDGSEWEHLRPRNRTRFWIWIAAAGLLIGLIIGIRIRWFSPYIEDASVAGYVESIDRQGDLIKTYEGVLIPYNQIHDTTRRYREDFNFTAADVHVASMIKRQQNSGRPVRLEYKVYHAPLPWRGESCVVVTRVDSVDPATLLPPDLRPGIHR